MSNVKNSDSVDLAATQEQALNIYRQACRFRDSGMNLKALKALNQAIALDENLIAAYFARARILIKLGRHLKAQCDYYTVTLLDPTNSEAHYLLADLSMLLGQYESARSYLEQGINISPSADSYLKLARLLEQRFVEYDLADKYFVYAITPQLSPIQRIDIVRQQQLSGYLEFSSLAEWFNQPPAEYSQIVFDYTDQDWQATVNTSWEFLYEITEKVLDELTEEDRALIHLHGRVLAEHGMVYTHVVRYITQFHGPEVDTIPWGN